MPLDFSIVQTPFSLGVEEGVDAHHVPLGTLTTAENVVWAKQNQVRKRFGTSRLTQNLLGGGTLSSASRIFARGSELCLISSGSLYAYSSAAGAWRAVDSVPELGATWSTHWDSHVTARYFDSALSSGGVRVDAFVSGAVTAEYLSVRAVDHTTGAVLYPLTVLSPSGTVGCRVIILGTTAIIITKTSATNITAYSLDLTTFTMSAGTNLRTDADAAGTQCGAWDATAIDASTFVLAYGVATPTLNLFSYNSALVQQASATMGSVNVGISHISVSGSSSDTIYVAFIPDIANPDVRVVWANGATLVQSAGAASIEAPGVGFQTAAPGIVRVDGTKAVLAYTMTTSFGARATTWQILGAGSAVANSFRGTYGTYVLARPFLFGGSVYLPIRDFPSGSAVASTFANTLIVNVDYSVMSSPVSHIPHRIVAKVEHQIGGLAFDGTAGSSTRGFGPLTSVTAVSSTQAFLPLPYQSTQDASYTSARQGLRLVTLTRDASVPSDTWRTTTYSSEVQLGGGLFSAYDGRIVFDYVFARAPLIYDGVVSGVGGSIAAGTYLYSGVQEFRSNANLLHRSAAATGLSRTTAGATSSVALRYVGHNITNKQKSATGFGATSTIGTLLQPYRTTVGGSTYQRLVPLTITADATVSSATGTDTNSDAGASLSSRAALYTTGGILDDYAPPSTRTHFLHKQRLFALIGDGLTWWYSKSFLDDLGTVPGFNPSFRIAMDETQTAGASLDDKAIFYSATGIWYMLGGDQGPSASGANNDFGTPVKLQSDVGCTNPRSLVSMPDGHMFQSARGIYLLTRGLETVWIGRPVRDVLASYPNVTSAVLVAKYNQVRFTANSSDGTAGVVLVYDYVLKQWSTFKYYDVVTVRASTPIVDACVWNGAYTFVTPYGTVYTETESSYLDDTHYTQMTLETAWISAAPQIKAEVAPLAFKSVRQFMLNGKSNTNHDLTISVGFDSDTSYPQSVTFAAQGAVTTIGDLEKCAITIGTRRKCESIRFRIQDATPTTGAVGTGQGPTFDTMGIELGLKRGGYKVPATKQG